MNAQQRQYRLRAIAGLRLKLKAMDERIAASEDDAEKLIMRYRYLHWELRLREYEQSVRALDPKFNQMLSEVKSVVPNLRIEQLAPFMVDYLRETMPLIDGHSAKEKQLRGRIVALAQIVEIAANHEIVSEPPDIIDGDLEDDDL